MTTRHRAAFYANGVRVWCPDEPDAGWIIAEARDWGAEWLVFDEQRETGRHRRFFLELQQAATSAGVSLELVHTAEPGHHDGSAVRVYRFATSP